MFDIMGGTRRGQPWTWTNQARNSRTIKAALVDGMCLVTGRNTPVGADSKGLDEL